MSTNRLTKVTAVSIKNELYEDIEAERQRRKMTRSAYFAEALKEYTYGAEKNARSRDCIDDDKSTSGAHCGVDCHKCRKSIRRLGRVERSKEESR